MWHSSRIAGEHASGGQEYDGSSQGGRTRTGSGGAECSPCVAVECSGGGGRFWGSGGTCLYNFVFGGIHSSTVAVVPGAFGFLFFVLYRRQFKLISANYIF